MKKVLNVGKDWTIDTCVLYRAADLDYDAIEFLNRTRRGKHKITLDFEKKIEIEYKKCFKKSYKKKGCEAVKKWFVAAVDKLIQKFSSNLDHRHKQDLQRLQFDRSDYPFVAVSALTLNKKLVTEDMNDYTEQIKKYLSAEFGIRVLSTKEALEI